MQEKYTEDIDKLDTFYQDALQEASVEPPAYMWDKISASFQEQEKPKGFFFKRSTILLLLLLLTIAASTVVFFIVKDNSTPSPETPFQKNNTEQNTIAPSSEETEESSNENNKKNTGTSSKKQFSSSTNSQIIKGDSVMIEPDKINETAEEQKIAEPTKSITDTATATPVVAPKKKVSFREKHKQEYNKDSLRPLFIPVK